MKKTTQRIIIVVAMFAALGLFFLFLYDILIPFIRLEIKNDVEGAQKLLTERGVLGFLSVMMVEALQMVVIFIPAEFIQISSGLSYPFYIALLLCDLGVCLGATIIYVLVNTFRFSNAAYEKNEKMIEKLAAGVKKRDRSTQLLLYLLFIMPLIPFGAICYYGSYRKMKYPRYILTVATGVIPSIVTSNLMGAAIRYFIGTQLPLWLLILIIVGLGAILFTVLFLFLNRIYFRQNVGTPDSVYGTGFFGLLHLLRRHRQRLHIDAEKLTDLPTPYIALANHGSYYDLYYVKQLFNAACTTNPSYVMNKHIISHPLIRKPASKAGMITKKLFYPDVKVPVQIMRMLKKGYPVVLFPEARLSLDGCNNPIVDKSASFYRRLKTDVVIIRIRGAYFANPKWRKKFFRSDIYVSVDRVITKEEIADMTDDELNALIDASLTFDESEAPVNTYKRRDMAKGLENVLYRCIDCGALYTVKGVGNEFVCSACGRRHAFDAQYRFTDEPYTIGGYYRRIKELERKDLPGFRFETDVTTTVFHDTGKYKTHETGHCVLDETGFSYRSDKTSFTVGYDALPALPFSVNAEFETYHNGDLYYFYPTENRRQVVRWALIVDLIKEMRDEKGQ